MWLGEMGSQAKWARRISPATCIGGSRWMQMQMDTDADVMLLHQQTSSIFAPDLPILPPVPPRHQCKPPSARPLLSCRRLPWCNRRRHLRRRRSGPGNALTRSNDPLWSVKGPQEGPFRRGPPW